MPKTLNILIAEDDRFIATALRILVTRTVENVSITMVHNGMAAIDALNERHFHMVISDWNMPKMSGVQLLKFVRENESTRTIPFLMLTARGDKGSVMSALEEGVTEYIAKPFSNKIVADKIRGMLSSLGA